MAKAKAKGEGGARRLKCKARCKNGDRKCNNWAVRGHTVCRMHGAGTHVRVASGERQDPTTTNLRHGLYAKRARGKIAQRAMHYTNADAGELFDLKQQAAILFGALEVADEANDYIAVAKIVSQLLRVTSQHTKLQQAGTKMVPEAQVVGLITVTLGWLQEIVADPTIPREDIERSLAARLVGFAKKLGGTED